MHRCVGERCWWSSKEKGIVFKYHDEERKDDENEDEDGMCFGQKDTVKLVVNTHLKFCARFFPLN